MGPSAAVIATLSAANPAVNVGIIAIIPPIPSNKGPTAAAKPATTTITVFVVESSSVNLLTNPVTKVTNLVIKGKSTSPISLDKSLSLALNNLL